MLHRAGAGLFESARDTVDPEPALTDPVAFLRALADSMVSAWSTRATVC